MLFTLTEGTALDLPHLLDMSLHLGAGLIVAHDSRSEHIQQFLGALGTASHGLHHRHAHHIFQLPGIDADAAALGLICHIEVDEERDPLFQQLHCQEQVAGNIGAVHHVHDQIQLVVGQIVDDNLFLRGSGVDAVGTGQIHNGNGTVLVTGIAHFLIHGDTRPVADFLPRTGEFIEDCGLAGIGIAGKCYC